MILLLALSLLRYGKLSGKPVNRPPQPSAQYGENDEVDAERGEEKSGENDLEGSERGVGSFENGGCRSRREDGLPEIDEKG